MAQFDHLVVGAGFAGSVCAERLASAGKAVLLIDQRAHIGGNAYDYYDDAGILVHKYGAHIFHTNSRDVVDYLTQFTAWRPYVHRVLAQVGDKLLPVPINTTTLAAFGGDIDAAKNAIIRPYTRKQWGCEPEDLDPSVLARVKTRTTTADDRYFTDTFQCMPAHGYTRLFERMLAHPNIKILLKTNYREVCALLRGGHNPPPYGPELPRVIYTGPIDEFFDYQFGRLEYRSARFAFETKAHVDVHSNDPHVLPAGVVNFPSEDIKYTRMTEFKHLTGQVHPMTTVAFEYPSATGEPFWPVPKPANAARYQEYAALAKQTPGVHFVGRLGRYAYINMDAAVAQALKLSRQLLMEL